MQLSHRPIQSTWAKINMKVSAGFLISNTFQHPVLVRPLIAVFVFKTDEDLIKYGWPEDIW